MAPAGTRTSVVYFHRSHIRQRNGHSRLVRKMVATSSTFPADVRSGSTRKACGFQGSSGSFGPRWARIQESEIGSALVVSRNDKRAADVASFVDGMECPPIDRGLGREEVAEGSPGGRTVLESPLRKNRHLQAGDRFDAPANDLALEV